MIDGVVLGAFFTLGFVVGAITVIATTIYYANKSGKKRDSKEKAVKTTAVSEKILQVKNITATQLELQAQIEQPQKSGLDGKHKNGLNEEIKKLEDEKIAILQSILADGFDPLISVSTMSGSVENVKLSDFMTRNGLISEAPTDPAAPGSPKKIGKFVVYTGKTDNNGGGETVH
jgi:hypothetical protein